MTFALVLALAAGVVIGWWARRCEERAECERTGRWPYPFTGPRSNVRPLRGPFDQDRQS